MRGVIGPHVRTTLLVFLVLGCGGQEDGPLVEVAGRPIDAADLRGYREQLPPEYLPAEQGVAAVRELLGALVDRQIMVAEAERLGYHESSEFKTRRQRLTTERLVQAMQQDEFGERLRVTDDDVRRIFVEQHWNRKILPAHIVSVTREEAQQVIELLDAGWDFHELARERSIAADAAEGGFLDYYFSPGDAMSNLVAGVYGLPVGAYTREPVETQDGWEVVKVLDEQAVPLQQVRDKLARAAHREQFFKQRNEFVAQLRQKHVGRISDDASPDSLLVAEARARGLHERADFRRFDRSLYERMLVTYLRRKEVLEDIPVTDAEVAADYEKTRTQYRVPGRVEGTRVIAGTEELALEVAQLIGDGGDPQSVARERGLALAHIHIPDTEKAYEKFRHTAVGDVIGPVAVKEKFEVLRIDAVETPRMRTLEEVEHIARHKIRLRRIRASFEVYIEQLRRKYEPGTIWHDARIESFAGEGI